MIFVTVGQEKYPFDRLIKVIDQAVRDKVIDNNVFAQIGNCQYKPKMFPFERMISFDQMVEQIKKATVIVAHAGIGSTLLCASLGKPPILFPRNFSLGEHLDDHQLEFAKKIESCNKVIVAYNAEQLIYDINNYPRLNHEKSAFNSENKSKLVNYLRLICSEP